MPAPKQMDVKVRDRFPARRSVVDHDAESVCESFPFGNLTGDQEQMSKNGLVIRSGLAHAGNEFFGNDEQMNRRLGSNIADDDALLVLMNLVCGDFPGTDFFKDGTHDKNRSYWDDQIRREDR